MSTKNSIFSEAVIQKQWRDKDIPNNQKLRELINTRLALQETPK